VNLNVSYNVTIDSKRFAGFALKVRALDHSSSAFFLHQNKRYRVTAVPAAVAIAPAVMESAEKKNVHKKVWGTRRKMKT